MLLITNKNEIITVWCQSEMLSVAAVIVSCRAALVIGKKWYILVILQMKPDESCSAWL